uniref:Glycosyltransferase 2-like domain-containing protein n=1 Tax=Coccolithus braarudii TaxID=221442 RepID=A0A7S0Q4V0_9EUKA
MLPDLLASLDFASEGTPLETFLVSAGSTDGSAELIEAYVASHPLAYNLSLPTKCTAGAARNLVIPLLEGRYTFFIDADDALDPAALVRAARHAASLSAQVLLMPYSLVYVHAEGRDVRGMDKWDVASWALAQGHDGTDQALNSALSLINYPWNKLVLTELMHERDVFFGLTAVQNDVQFHNTALLAAKGRPGGVAFLQPDSPAVCYHNKFVGSDRFQLTKTASAERVQMLAAISQTHRALAHADVDFCSSSQAALWLASARKLFTWALSNKLVPPEHTARFVAEKNRLLACIQTCREPCFP